MKEISENLSSEKYRLQFLDTISNNPQILLWLTDHRFNIIYANNTFNNNIKSFSDHERIALIINEQLEYHPFKSYIQSLYRKVLNGEIIHRIIRLPNEHWIKFWLYKGKNESTVVGFGSDVTTEIASRISLIKSEQMFRNIFESLQDIYFKCRIDGKLLMISPSVEDITGYKPEELLGKNITNYYLYSVTTKALLRTLIKRKGIRNIEVSVIDKSGRIIPSLCTFRLIYDEGWIIEGNVKDIAEIKEAHEELKSASELAEQSLKIKEKFLANMSHEIRTPLNGIIGMVNVLERTQLDKTQVEQVKAIKQSSDILLSLLNNLLDWSKLEAGKMELQLSPVSPKNLLEKITLMYQHRAVEKNISLAGLYDEAIPEFILSDEVKLTQIISNLVSNAIKFTLPEGAVTLQFELISEYDNQVKLKCTVRDTGVGIREEERNRLFESFTQLDSSENKRHEGAGLGLSISKELVMLLGGEIGMESEPGKGSSFWFTFRAMITEKKSSKISRIIRISKRDFRPRILVVDDNRINLEVAGQILKNAGGDIQKASSGNEAVHLIQQERFDLVLLDIQMPEMSGIDVLKWMQHELKEIPPVIALTAYHSQKEREKYLALGFTDFIGKPFNPEELLLKVKELVAVQEQVIDMKVLYKLKQYGGAEMVREALNEFYDDTEKLIKECFVSLSNQNHKQILDNLHTIKGNAGTLGINKVARSAMYLEDSLKRGQILQLNKELQDMEHLFVEFKALYKEQF